MSKVPGPENGRRDEVAVGADLSVEELFTNTLGCVLDPCVIGELVGQMGARRAVLDSLTSLALGVSSGRRFKELVYATSGQGISFTADNIILLKYVRGGAPRTRYLRAQGARRATRDRRAQDERQNRGIEVGGPYKCLRGVLTGLPTPLGSREP